MSVSAVSRSFLRFDRFLGFDAIGPGIEVDAVVRVIEDFVGVSGEVVYAFAGVGVDAVVERVDEERAQGHAVRMGDALAIRNSQRSTTRNAVMPVSVSQSALSGKIIDALPTTALEFFAVGRYL